MESSKGNEKSGNTHEAKSTSDKPKSSEVKLTSDVGKDQMKKKEKVVIVLDEMESEDDEVPVVRRVMKKDMRLAEPMGSSQADPKQKKVSLADEMLPEEDEMVEVLGDGEDVVVADENLEQSRKRQSKTNLAGEERAKSRQRCNRNPLFFRDLSFPEAYEDMSRTLLDLAGMENRIVMQYNEKIRSLRAACEEEKAKREAAEAELETYKTMYEDLTFRVAEIDHKLKELKVQLDEKERRNIAAENSFAEMIAEVKILSEENGVLLNKLSEEIKKFESELNLLGGDSSDEDY